MARWPQAERYRGRKLRSADYVTNVFFPLQIFSENLIRESLRETIIEDDSTDSGLERPYAQLRLFAKNQSKEISQIDTRRIASGATNHRSNAAKRLRRVSRSNNAGRTNLRGLCG